MLFGAYIMPSFPMPTDLLISTVLELCPQSFTSHEKSSLHPKGYNSYCQDNFKFSHTTTWQSNWKKTKQYHYFLQHHATMKMLNWSDQGILEHMKVLTKIVCSKATCDFHVKVRMRNNNSSCVTWISVEIMRMGSNQMISITVFAYHLLVLLSAQKGL